MMEDDDGRSIMIPATLATTYTFRLPFPCEPIRAYISLDRSLWRRLVYHSELYIDSLG